MRVVLATLGMVLLLAPGAARAVSGFRISGMKAKPYGAELELAFNNTWPTAEQTAKEKDVRLFVHTQLPGASVETGPSVKEVGVVEMPGDGQVKVRLDYAKLGLQPGQTIWLHGRWVASNHGWGEPWSVHGRSAGSQVLPAAAKNSLLRRLASPLRYRWPAPLQPAQRGRSVAPRLLRPLPSRR